MKSKSLTASLILILAGSYSLFAQQSEMLIYHNIKTDRYGKIIPWYDPDPGKSYDHVINLVWNFWDHMRQDLNGLPYYMNHQVWNRDFNDPRGIGGDQFAMALSSWNLLYQYTGNERIKANMYFIADYYLTHGLTPPDCRWPLIPFPYNTMVYSGLYDGDMRSGKGVAQPDKAGSLGYELVKLYKMSPGYNVGENKFYLEGAINIANTLAAHIKEGDVNYSPLPFKVNVYTGKTELLRYHDFTSTWIDTACYTTNWTPTLRLFQSLIDIGSGDTATYRSGFATILKWMKTYPLKNNKWGPFFEDVDWWSDTQMNAMSFARYMMEHREFFPGWKDEVNRIIKWCHDTFSNRSWEKYGVIVTNEQTVYQMPGNSHSSRQAADELLYVSLSGDSSLYSNAVRELNWATYMVDFDGKNRYPGDEPWLTDGYGDYVRHFLRAMASSPELAPQNADHILSTTSTVQQADYKNRLKKFYGLSFENIDSSKVVLFYRTYEQEGTETIRLSKKPSQVMLEYKPLIWRRDGEGVEWKEMKQGGLLIIHRNNGKRVIILQ